MNARSFIRYHVDAGAAWARWNGSHVFAPTERPEQSGAYWAYVHATMILAMEACDHD